MPVAAIITKVALVNITVGIDHPAFAFAPTGNQIAFVTTPNRMQLVVSDEDFENGEIPPVEAAEIRERLWHIIREITCRGFDVLVER